MKITREITVLSFRVLIFLYMPLGRQAGSNQHRGNLGNCLTVSLVPRRQRSFSVFTGELWSSTYSQLTCCDVTAQLQSHMVSLYYQELRSDTQPWHTVHKKEKKRKCPCINPIACLYFTIIKLSWCNGDVGFFPLVHFHSLSGSICLCLSLISTAIGFSSSWSQSYADIFV